MIQRIAHVPRTFRNAPLRSFLLLMLLFSVLLFFMGVKTFATLQGQTRRPSFVSRSQTTLFAGNQPLGIIGVNSYDLAYRSQADITTDFSYFHRMGVNTVRLWAFGDGISDGFQPTPGNFNQKRLMTFDYILALANQYHIYLIPTLVNNWQDYGGKTQYVKWFQSDSSDAFYTDDRAKKMFEDYISMLLNRENTITHVIYKNDQQILAWDLMNEPRTEDHAQNNDIIRNWASTLTTYIKTIDHNHLVMLGTETLTQSATHTQPLCTLSTVDICSVHFYLDEKTIHLYPSITSVEQTLTNQHNAADRIKKPLLLEEIGISKAIRPFGMPGTNVFSLLLKSAPLRHTGVLVWNWSLHPDTSFGFSPAATEPSAYTDIALQKILGTRGVH